MNGMYVQLQGPSLKALERLSRFTGRPPLQTVIDALNVYEWIVTEQQKGRSVVIREGTEDLSELVRFSRDAFCKNA